MTLPGFTRRDRRRAGGPSYGFGGTAEMAAPGVVAAAFGPLRFPVIRCCRRAPLLGNRFVCTQRTSCPGRRAPARPP